MFPEGGLDRLVAQQPYLLMADVDEVVGKMEMCVWLWGGGGVLIPINEPTFGTPYLSQIQVGGRGGGDTRHN